ncbi:MAG: hypothetical protein AB1Z19_01640 [Eubacteriales bacterium]
MKKTWIMIGALVFALALMTGCTGVSDEAADLTQGTSVPADETNADQETAVNDDSAMGAILYGEDLTIEEMMTYAIQDEYLARQTYENIMSEYGEVTPFSNIIEAEVYHIELLTTLFDKYNYALPGDDGTAHEVSPRSFEEALQAGVVAEENNIAMYDYFLSYDLPEDVRGVFEDLKAASENHLAAFERSQIGGGSGKGNGNGYGKNSSN